MKVGWKTDEWSTMFHLHDVRCITSWSRDDRFRRYGACIVGHWSLHFSPQAPAASNVRHYGPTHFTLYKWKQHRYKRRVVRTGGKSHRTKRDTENAQKLNVNNGTLRYVTCVVGVRCNTYKGKLQHNLPGHYVLMPGKREKPQIYKNWTARGHSEGGRPPLIQTITKHTF